MIRASSGERLTRKLSGTWEVELALTATIEGEGVYYYCIQFTAIVDAREKKDKSLNKHRIRQDTQSCIDTLASYPSGVKSNSKKIQSWRLRL